MRDVASSSWQSKISGGDVSEGALVIQVGLGEPTLPSMTPLAHITSVLSHVASGRRASTRGSAAPQPNR